MAMLPLIRALGVCLGLCIAGTGGAAAQTQPAAQGAAKTPSESLAQRSTEYLWWGDFEALAKLHREVDGPGKFDADGAALIQEFRSGLGRVIGEQGGVGDLYLIELDALTAQWATAAPMSALAHMLHARTLVARAWAYRGSGLGNTVTPENRQLFRQQLQRAAQHLASVEPVIRGDSSSHRELLVAARGLGLDLKTQANIAQQGLRANPDDLGLWAQLLTSSLPKWQGDAEEVDRLIKSAVAATREKRGEDLYARLYSYAEEEEFSRALFEDSLADWPRMKKGFADLLKRWPNSTVFWNRYAYLACLARDRQALADALDKVGDKPLLDQWGANARRVFEGCQRLARQT